VALSFAGGQREYVGRVAEALKARRVRCFYDADELVRLWGAHLAEELPRIYARESAAVVVFVSADYAERDWTRLERRAAFSRAVTEAGVYVLPARFDDSELPGLLPDVVYIDLRHYTPEQFADLVVAKIADLGITASASSSGAGRVPPGGVRVAEADPRLLGVHRAISVPGLPDSFLPEYVPRDADAAEFGVRAKVAAAAEQGGFVLLVGGSSVGKTRCAVEAVKALLPDWWLVHPGGAAEVAALVQVPRTVVWLDELQRYLDGEHGLAGGTIRALLNAPHPAVIIGTLWPDRYAAYTVMPTSGGTDSHAREREVLDLADAVHIDAEFSPAEQDGVWAAAARDRRLAVALEATGYGVTQTLAAAPQLVAHWQHARTGNPYAWAVLTAALDAARLGVRAPLSDGFLRAAAPGYCTSQQQAEAPDDWFEQALAYVTSELRGAATALSPAGAGMGQVAGYTAADYLIQHANRERRLARLPASTWDAFVSHIRDPADAVELADSAGRRLLYRYAIPLYRVAANAGVVIWAAWELAGLLARRGDVDGLRVRADAGDEHAALKLAGLLFERGDVDGLRARADAGDPTGARYLATVLEESGDMEAAEDLLRGSADAGDRYAAPQLASLLAQRGDVDGLRARVDADDGHAAAELASLLNERRDFDGAVQTVRAAAATADISDRDVAERLIGSLAGYGDWDGVAQLLRARADAGDKDAARRLAGMLAGRGDVDGLRARADAGDEDAARGLADLLARLGDVDGLRGRADLGDQDAAWRLMELLTKRGDVDGLRALAGAGDENAALQLPGLLAGRGDVDGLRALAGAGDENAALQLADLLAERGDLDGAEQTLRAVGGEHAAWRLAGLLEERGDPDGAMQVLRTQADLGDREAAERLARRLATLGDVDGLRARADLWDGAAAAQLARLLLERGEPDRATQILRAANAAGNGAAAWRLANQLAEHGDLDGAEQILRTQANTGDEDVAERLVDLLEGRGDLDGAAQVLRAATPGNGDAAWRLADLLEGRGDLDGAAQVLRARIATGDQDHAEPLADRLTELLVEQGRSEQAERLRRFGLNPDGSIACE
jgi:hypothetical protein